METQAERNLKAYRFRIAELCTYAREDGYTLNDASEQDLLRFLQFASTTRRANLVLADDGNLRAIWKDSEGSRLALYFLGNGVVQYVIFNRSKGAQSILRDFGSGSFEGVVQKIEVFELQSLVWG